MKRMIAILSLTCCLVVLAQGAAAQSPAAPPHPLAPLPAAPWRTDFASFAPADDPAFLELPVALDSFLVLNYPNENLGHEESVWFGTDPDLGHIRAFLQWELPPIPGTYVGAAVYLPIGGTNEAQAMTGYAYRLFNLLSEESSPYWLGTEPYPFASFTAPAEIGWVHFDVTSQLQGWVYNFGIQLRGPESAQKTIKGMFSREAEPGSPVATLVIAYTPDETPPYCSLGALPPVSASTVNLSANCSDPDPHRSGVHSVTFQRRVNDGPWETFLTRGSDWWYTPVYGLRGGQTYAFRVQAEDWAGNLSTWTADAAAVTTIESIPPEIQPGSGFNDRWTTRSSSYYWQQNAITVYDPGSPSSGLGVSESYFLDTALGGWQKVADGAPVPWEVGHTYRFMLRAVDAAGNASEWFYYGPVTVAARYVRGAVSDADGVRVPGLPLRITPAPLNAPVIMSKDEFKAFMPGHDPLTLAAAAPQFYLFPRAGVAGGADDVYSANWTLYPVWNALVNGDFEAPWPTGWQVTGAVTAGQGPEGWSSRAAHLTAAGGPGLVELSQTITVPADMLYPLLSWWGMQRESSYPGEYAMWRVSVRGPDGNRVTVAERAIEPWYAPPMQAMAVDLSPWAGQLITVYFTLDPRGSTTADYWLDEAHISPRPLNAGVQLTADNTRPAAGSEVKFILRATNYRQFAVDAPIAVTWPAGWSFVSASVTPTASAADRVEFTLPLAAPDVYPYADSTQTVEIRLAAPATSAASLDQVRAALLDPLARLDYAPHDNTATVNLMVNGLPLWLPVIRR